MTMCEKEIVYLFHLLEEFHRHISRSRTNLQHDVGGTQRCLQVTNTTQFIEII